MSNLVSEDSRWADAWEQTSSLLALRELTRLSEQVAPAVANRAGLTHNELRTLEHLVEGPMGPGELSRVLGVSSAASSGIIDRLVARGHARRPFEQLDFTLLGWLNEDLVAERDELKQGLQVMIAIGPAAEHMKKQIELGRRGPAGHARGVHGKGAGHSRVGSTSQCSTSKRRLRSPRSRVSRVGKGTSATRASRAS